MVIATAGRPIPTGARIKNAKAINFDNSSIASLTLPYFAFNFGL